MKTPKIAIIDDNKYLLKIIADIILKEFNNDYSIEIFDDFVSFIRVKDINIYDIIVCDFYFDGYSLNDINMDKNLNKYNGKFFVLSANFNSIKSNKYYSRIIDKSHVIKPTFKFSKFF